MLKKIQINKITIFSWKMKIEAITPVSTPPYMIAIWLGWLTHTIATLSMLASLLGYHCKFTASSLHVVLCFWGTCCSFMVLEFLSLRWEKKNYHTRTHVRVFHRGWNPWPTSPPKFIFRMILAFFLTFHIVKDLHGTKPSGLLSTSTGNLSVSQYLSTLAMRPY